MACRRRGAGTGCKRRSVRRRRLLLAWEASNPPELTTRPARRPDQGTGAPRRQAISPVRPSRALNGVFKKPVRHRLGKLALGILRRTFFAWPDGGFVPETDQSSASTQQSLRMAYRVSAQSFVGLQAAAAHAQRGDALPLPEQGRA